MAQASGRVLVVDDDEDTCILIEDILETCGYEVRTCLDGEEALQILNQQKFHVILSDIKMPGSITGIDLLLHVRRMDLDTEVILVTAYGSLETAIQAVRGEAFDYLTKPFSLDELRQAVRQAVLTRSSTKRRRAVTHYEDLSIDQKARRVWVGEREVTLTRLEFDVLACLFESLGGAVSRQELLQQVWDCTEEEQRNEYTVKSCVSRLRKKLGDNAQNPQYIHNIWGVGYQLGK